MTQQNQNQGQQIQIKLTDEVMAGVYSNLMYISHSKEEFVFDFIFLQGLGGKVNSRVITSPKHAKRIVRALEENIKKYENQFGVIEEAKSDEKEMGFNYQKS